MIMTFFFSHIILENFMELTPEQNEVCDEAIRCLDCLMDSDQPFDDYLDTYCRGN